MTETARFLKWGTKIDACGVQLTMIVLPDKGKGPISVTIPNKTRRRVLDPPADVARLATTLKVGDRVRLSYDKLLSRRTYKSAIATGAGQTGDSKPIVFEFGYLKKVRQGGKHHLSVVATRGPVSWIFLVPNEDDGPAKAPAAAGAKTYLSAAKRAALEPNPKAELAGKLKKYRRGDTVHLKYEPYKYVFLLEDIESARQSGEGTVLSKRRWCARARVTRWFISGWPRAGWFCTFPPPTRAPMTPAARARRTSRPPLRNSSRTRK